MSTSYLDLRSFVPPARLNVVVTNRLLDDLHKELVREFDIPVVLTVATLCTEDQEHERGNAVDVTCDRVSPEDVQRIARDLGFPGITVRTRPVGPGTHLEWHYAPLA